VGVGERRAVKPSELVDVEEPIRLAERPAYVSRGGIKLANALTASGVRVEGRLALDLGASTGGFTDCLLQRGARQVIAVDVGYGTLDYRLRVDPRVRVMERTNARELTPALLAEAASKEEGPSEAVPSSGEPASLPDLATIDVSFISIAKILGAVLGCLAPDYDVLAMIKPQFEVGKGRVGKGGVVRESDDRRSALVSVGESALALGAAVRGYYSSQLPGPKGNRETFIWLADPAARTGAADAGELETMARVVEP
jgi:23S rRNA (cytidine1920-2'-O)/16S rRNA (cytidine1409-2'-O)-methyltransferase